MIGKEASTLTQIETEGRRELEWSGDGSSRGREEANVLTTAVSPSPLLHNESRDESVVGLFEEPGHRLGALEYHLTSAGDMQVTSTEGWVYI